ncbi:hypothetical protein L873DRAFT_1067579 [Choiromyces venosus 120613-1]|uniref:Uncharacterized protein n=1 Tax=Choiromyces venosus 120613-1 TaxID=1336337 RepID=A0A3N4JMR6_9PEZI|nr:hypothetical protein L873DRAFT_1067579 [Choiromyces venosus 120613-1]
MRSHPCNAVGSQLLIVGGYPSSVRVDITAPSDSELIKVLDMNEMSWSSRYTPGTIYKTPDLVRKKAEFHLGRIDPHSGWADDGLRDAFHYSINGTTSGKPPPQKLSGGEIAAIAVSIVIGVPLLLFVIFCLIFGSLPKPQSPPPDRPFSNRPNPEVVEERPARPIDL